MNRFVCLLVFLVLAGSGHADPLRVFIRGGKKSHGPNQHEHERFLRDWKTLLAERGVRADGALEFPSAEQLAQTDVLVMYAQEGGNITPEQRPALETFLRRGGGLVVIHTASVANQPETSPYWKSIIGGSWVAGKTKWKEGPMDLYYTENQQIGGGHPITRGASNFHLDDEIYYDMDLAPDIRVLATAYTPNVKDGKKTAEGGRAHIYDIQPQMWTYERTAEGGSAPYRAFVSIPGHLYGTFEKPNYRAILLRGIAWAGQRENVDEFTRPEEVSALTYPAGGPEKPEQTLANLEVHPDFTMKLVAAEPLITKPINFDWDPAGRLWVAETPEYPNGRRGMRPDYRGKEWKDHGGIDPTPGEQTRQGQDKISILADTNGDGAMDKKEVFYAGLDLVTGFVFHRDGVIATQAPDILFIRDTDGDGKGETVEKLYTGLGTRDTHAVINNPRWGWDGWIYATHGYSSSSEVKNAKGETQGTIGSGVVRFRPDGSKIEQYSSKGGNTWGLAITGDNRVMWTQPTSGQLLMHTVLPEHVLGRGKIGNTPSFKVVEPSPKSFPLMSWEQLAYVQIDWVGSFTAAAGCAIYDGGTWPAEYHGDYFVTEPTINVIHHTRLSADGSSYTAKKLAGREETEFVRSRDMWWRPIETRVGPDGALYVGDFYNQAVIHNDTRGPDHNNVNAAVRPDRDHYFGRIWRIDHRQARQLAVPDLTKAGADELVQALESPNRAVRMTAMRLLTEAAAKNEGGREGIAAALQPLGAKASPEVRIAALWTALLAANRLPEAAAFADPAPEVRRNAALIAESKITRDPAEKGTVVGERGVSVELLADANPQVRIAALRALGSPAFSESDARAVVAAWSKLDDDFQRSAAVAAGSWNPVAAIAAALDAAAPNSLKSFVATLADGVATQPENAGQLIGVLAGKPATADDLKIVVLESLAKNLKQTPPMTPPLAEALNRLLAGTTAQAVLPLAARWDQVSGEMKGRIGELIGQLLATLENMEAREADRLSAARALLGLRGALNRELVPRVAAQLGKGGAASFQRQLIQALAAVDDVVVGRELSAAFGKFPAEVQAVAFDTVLKRPDWANAFLDAVQAKQVDFAMLGPANTYRLRTHATKKVAERATALFDELNPLAKAKKDAIARLLPVVEGKGDPEKGKQLFAASCAICHNFHGVGANVGPGLTGMGSHGAAELLAAIVDPNAEVDPSFAAWNIETRDGQLCNGVIESENPTTITLKSLAGVQQVKVAEVKTRTNTGRSLMPEGFEGLGAETLRDLIAYMQSADGGRFRTLDLREAFTASTSTGLYVRQENRSDSFVFNRTGNVSVEGVPFHIVSPEKSPRNIIVLKGGPPDSYAKTLSQKVEVKGGGFKANRLHVLGGVTGWGYRRAGGDSSEVLKLTIAYADGQRENLVCRNGAEFADYIERIDVPGSKFAEGLVKNHQVRWFTKPLSRAAEIEKIVLESFDSGAAPTLLAITAELADPNAPIISLTPDAAAPAAAVQTPDFVPQFTDAVPQPPASANGPRVLLVGGGSSHNFVKFFGETDKATLAPGAGWIEFTQNANSIAAILDRVDVLVWSANQPISSETRQALMNYVKAGKGLIAYHPGTWYAWPNFPQWNQEVVGGGARGHDRLGAFEVAVTNPAHPIMAGVPARFAITDELYNFIPDAQATPIEVLATATSPASGQTFPQVFVVKHPQARIVGLTLGHDQRAHDLPAFQTILRQAVAWAAGR